MKFFEHVFFWYVLLQLSETPPPSHNTKQILHVRRIRGKGSTSLQSSLYWMGKKPLKSFFSYIMQTTKLNEHQNRKKHTIQKAKLHEKQTLCPVVIWLRFVWRVNNKTQRDCRMISVVVNAKTRVHLMLSHPRINEAVILKIVEKNSIKENELMLKKTKPKFHISLVGHA